MKIDIHSERDQLRSENLKLRLALSAALEILLKSDNLGHVYKAIHLRRMFTPVHLPVVAHEVAS